MTPTPPSRRRRHRGILGRLTAHESSPGERAGRSARDYARDDRVVLTLDAGGTSFRFSAMQRGRLVVQTAVLPSLADDLDASLANIVEGFRRVREAVPAPPVAISFAFPGPADYAHGIIVSPGNLPAYRDVALGPMLEDAFGLPTFINNDGDLFTYGEATTGLLPYVNGLLEDAGSARRFRHLLGITLGTGLGAGIVRDGQLFIGDNSRAGEMWLFRHKLQPHTNAEEGASIRAVRRAYAEAAGIPLEGAPEPRQVARIADGEAPGDAAAAREAFRRLGEVAGDAVAIATTLLDALVVVGGGLAGAHRHLLPALVAEMNGVYTFPGGAPLPRLASRAFNLEDPSDLEAFLHGDPREITVPGGTRTITFDRLARIGVGVSRRGTSEATAAGAYAFALSHLPERTQRC